MAAESLFESLTDQIVTAVEDALAETGDGLPPLEPPDEPGARTALDALKRPRTADHRRRRSGPVGRRHRRLGGHPRRPRRQAFGGPNPLDSLIARVLEERMPRTAAFLMLVGVIVPEPDGRDRIDWPKAQQFFTDPGTLVNEELWDALLGDASIPGTGRLPAVIIGALLLAPQTILALARGDLRVAPLLPPPTDGPGAWRQFRERTANWISLTMPDRRPRRPCPDAAATSSTGVPTWSPTSVRHSRCDPIGCRYPAAAARSSSCGSRWPSEDDRGATTEADAGNGWYVRIEPGISAGFGYDGEWHGAFRQMLDQRLAGARTRRPGDRDLRAGARRRALPDVILGPPYDTRIVIRDLSAFLTLRENHPIFEIGAFVHGFSARAHQPVVAHVRRHRRALPRRHPFRPRPRHRLRRGRGSGSNLGAGLDVTFHIDKIRGKNELRSAFTIHSIQPRRPAAGHGRTASTCGPRSASTSRSSSVPATLVVDGLGGWVGYWTDDGEKQYVGFLPPTGAGPADLDAGAHRRRVPRLHRRAATSASAAWSTSRSARSRSPRSASTS